jgi:hypothetical protein
MIGKAIRLTLGVAVGILQALPAYACAACGCGLPGSSSDVSSVGGNASMFGGEGRWLMQAGMSFRDITGSFNERGDWVAKPQGSSLTTVMGNLGLTYYPQDGYSIGVQAPFAVNRLVGAQWGQQGAINPALDDQDNILGPRSAGGWGDLTVQGSAILHRGSEWTPAVATYAGVSLPTGTSAGDAAAFTGSGVVSGQVGLSLLKGFGPLELTTSATYQRPITTPQGEAASAFYIGQALIGQVQADVEVFAGWKVGLGANGFLGMTGVVDSAPTAAKLSKLKLVPSIEWRVAPEEGVRAAYGGDPTAGPWSNAMTDQTLFLVYYRYL